MEEIAAIRTDNDRSIVNAGHAVLIEWWKKISTKDIGPYIQELADVFDSCKIGGHFEKVKNDFINQ